VPVRCPRTRRAEAIRSLAAASHPRTRAALAEAVLRAGERDWRGLMIEPASDGSVRGAVWAQPLAGRYAVVWPPRSDSLSVETLLIAAARWCDEQRVCIGQILAEGTPDEPSRDTLERTGFPFIAPLLYLAGDGIQESGTSGSGPEWSRLNPTDRARFERLFRDVERGALDFPELHGVRPVDAVIDGFVAQGRHDPDLWLAARVDGVDAAMLLLTTHPGTDYLELVYMGVRPDYRGRGLGRTVVEKALACAYHRGCHILLSLDARNRPARCVYESAGLAQIARAGLHARIGSIHASAVST